MQLRVGVVFGGGNKRSNSINGGGNKHSNSIMPLALPPLLHSSPRHGAIMLSIVPVINGSEPATASYEISEEETQSSPLTSLMTYSGEIFSVSISFSILSLK